MSNQSLERERLEELLVGSADPEFSEEEREELNSMLRENAAARRFAARFLSADAALAEALGVQEAEAAFSEDQDRPEAVSKLQKKAWLAAAASIVLAVVWVQSWRIGVFDAPIVAQVSSANRASGFDGGEVLRPGQRIQFDKGWMAIKFGSGAKLAVKGPVDLRIANDNGAEMKRGTATVRVPGKIKGFTLDTPSEQVVDLGTSFGVGVAEDGATSIAVFEGEIELRGEQHTGGPQRLNAGASVMVREKTEAPSEIPYQFEDYLETWQASFGIVAMEGDVRVADPPERTNPGNAVDPDCLVAFPEKESVGIPAGFEVSASDPGSYSNTTKPRAVKQTVPLETSATVDSFLLQFHPDPDLEVNERRQFRGTLRFDRPIVGILVAKEMLDQTDSLLGLPGADFGGVFRRGIQNNDSVVLHPDRRTLEVSFDVTTGLDQIRVLVASE